MYLAMLHIINCTKRNTMTIQGDNVTFVRNTFNRFIFALTKRKKQRPGIVPNYFQQAYKILTKIHKVILIFLVTQRCACFHAEMKTVTCKLPSVSPVPRSIALCHVCMTVVEMEWVRICDSLASVLLWYIWQQLLLL